MREGRREGRSWMEPEVSAFQTSVAAWRPDQGPDHCSAWGSLGRTRRWKVWLSAGEEEEVVRMMARDSGSLKPVR
jgi:hypothetical protein